MISVLNIAVTETSFAHVHADFQGLNSKLYNHCYSVVRETSR